MKLPASSTVSSCIVAFLVTNSVTEAECLFLWSWCSHAYIKFTDDPCSTGSVHKYQW